MVKKTLGYVELEWTCPSCSARVPGSAKKCPNCGTPMPEKAKFELPGQQTLDTSAETAAQVTQGPDIHCPYCGTRNPGGVAKCSQCGGDLSSGARRAAGQVLGALDTARAPDTKCPHCGSMNPAAALKCSQCGGTLRKAPARGAPSVPARPAGPKLTAILLGVIALLVVCGGVLWLVNRKKESLPATVRAVQWTYVINVEELKPVTKEAWKDQLPAGARAESCTRKVRREEDKPVPGATEVCSTPRVVDSGTGKGQVVVDCKYLVTDDWCKYTATEWTPSGKVEAKGDDFSPRWPVFSPTAMRRERNREENYRVFLLAGDKERVYAPHTLQEFQRLAPGSQCKVTVNALGMVVSVEPAQ